MMQNPSESQEQIWLFEWAAVMSNKYPELNLMYHVPNGGIRTKGAGGKLKAEGMKKGVPDICLPVARNGSHGLYIEMKAGRNKCSKEQLEWIEALIEQGYHVAVCYGFNAAADVISEYLGIE